MCHILIGNLGYILLLNIPENQHHTFTSHLRYQSQHETGPNLPAFVPSQVRGVGATFARIRMEDATNFLWH